MCSRCFARNFFHAATWVRPTTSRVLLWLTRISPLRLKRPVTTVRAGPATPEPTCSRAPAPAPSAAPGQTELGGGGLTFDGPPRAANPRPEVRAPLLPAVSCRSCPVPSGHGPARNFRPALGSDSGRFPLLLMLFLVLRGVWG